MRREKRFCREAVSLFCCLNELHVLRSSHAYANFVERIRATRTRKRNRKCSARNPHVFNNALHRKLSGASVVCRIAGMATDASKSVSMITQLHRTSVGTVSASDTSHDVATSVTADDCVISEQEKRSGRRLRNLLLVGNTVVWIVIILAVRAWLF